MRGLGRFGGRVSAPRDPVRRALGHVVALVAGVSPAEGAAAVELGERVAGGVRLVGGVVDLALGRAKRAPLPGRVEVVSERVELASVEAEVCDAEVCEDAPRLDATRAVIVVEPRALARRSRYD